MASSKRKLLQPFKFRSSEEDNKRQYDALFGSPIVPLRPIPVPGSAILPSAQNPIGVLETSPDAGSQTPPVDVYYTHPVDVSFQPSVETVQTPTVGVSQSIEISQFEDIPPLTAKKPVQRENWPTTSSNELETPPVGVLKGEPIQVAETSQTPTGDVNQTPAGGVLSGIDHSEDSSKRTHAPGKTGEGLTSVNHGNISRKDPIEKTPTVGVLPFSEPAAVPSSQEGLNPTLMTPGAIELTSLCSSRAGIRFDFRYLGVWTENWRSIVINHFQCFIAPGSRVVGLRLLVGALGAVQ